MAITEKYGKVQSTRWDTATAYVVNDQCFRFDNNNYYCIKNQSNAEGVDPPAVGMTNGGPFQTAQQRFVRGR